MSVGHGILGRNRHILEEARTVLRSSERMSFKDASRHTKKRHGQSLSQAPGLRHLGKGRRRFLGLAFFSNDCMPLDVLQVGVNGHLEFWTRPLRGWFGRGANARPSEFNPDSGSGFLEHIRPTYHQCAADRHPSTAAQTPAISCVD